MRETNNNLISFEIKRGSVTRKKLKKGGAKGLELSHAVGGNESDLRLTKMVEKKKEGGWLALLRRD